MFTVRCARAANAQYTPTPQWVSGNFFKGKVMEGSHQAALVIKNPPANARNLRDAGCIPGSGRSPGGRNGNPLQYSCVGNPMDRRTWQAIVRGVI